MQLFALDEKGELIAAAHAQKQWDYHCLECRSKLRIRGGMHRQKHFFHLSPNRTCALSKKSLTHLQTQLRIQDRLPAGECLLEHPFPTINRIADCVWQTEKLVFEVQCSPITAEEVEDRNRDYSSLGYQVIWILHDKRFNKQRITAAEMVLRKSAHYFTNINEVGKGIIYDQFDFFQKGRRIHSQKPHPIDIKQPKKPKLSLPSPSLIHERAQSWSISFKGDLINTTNSAYHELENTLFPKTKVTIATLIKRGFYYLIIRPYFLVLQILLENASR